MIEMVGWETVGKSVSTMASSSNKTTGVVRRPKLLDIANTAAQLPAMKVLMTKLIELKGDAQSQNSALDSTIIQMQRLLSDDLETQLSVLQSESEKSPAALEEAIQVLIERASAPLQVSSRGVTSTVAVLSVLVNEVTFYNWESNELAVIFTAAANTSPATAGAMDFGIEVLSLISVLLEKPEIGPPALLQNQIFSGIASLALPSNLTEESSSGDTAWEVIVAYIEFLGSDELNWVFPDLEVLFTEHIYQFPAEVIDCLTSASASGCEETLRSVADNHLAAAMSLSSFAPELIIVVLGNVTLGIPNKVFPSSYYNIAFDILEQNTSVSEFCCGKHMYAASCIANISSPDLFSRKTDIAERLLSFSSSLMSLPARNIIFLIKIVETSYENVALPFSFLRSVFCILRDIYPIILHIIRTNEVHHSMLLELSPEVYSKDDDDVLPVLAITCLRLLLNSASQVLAFAKSEIAVIPFTIFDEKYSNSCFHEKTIVGFTSNLSSVGNLPQLASELLSLSMDIRSLRSRKQNSASSIIRSFRSSQCRGGVTLAMRNRVAVKACITIQSVYRMQRVFAFGKQLRNEKQKLLDRERRWRGGIWDAETRDSIELWEVAARLKQLLPQTLMRKEEQSRNNVGAIAAFTARELRYRGVLAVDNVVELVALCDEYLWQSSFTNHIERKTQRSRTVLMHRELRERHQLTSLFNNNLEIVLQNEKYHRQARVLFKISLKKRIRISQEEAEERDSIESYLLLKYLEGYDEISERIIITRNESRLWSVLHNKGIDVMQESLRRGIEIEWGSQLKKCIKEWNLRISVGYTASVTALAVAAVVGEGCCCSQLAIEDSPQFAPISLSPISSVGTQSVSAVEATPYLTPLTSDFGSELDCDPRQSAVAASVVILTASCSLLSSSLLELRSVVQNIHQHPSHYNTGLIKKNTTIGDFRGPQGSPLSMRRFQRNRESW